MTHMNPQRTNDMTIANKAQQIMYVFDQPFWFWNWNIQEELG